MSARISEKPRINGSLDENCWKHTQWQDDFSLLKSAAKANQQTEFAVCHDAENLYIAVRCREANPDKIKATVTERDSNVYQDDCVEIMVMPEENLHADSQANRYWHFIVNTLGTQLDQIVRGGVGERWDGDWAAAGGKMDGGWTVEIALPFALFDLPENVSGTWRINVARERYAGETELSSWALMGKDSAGFHSPELYGYLKGLNVDFSKQRFNYESIRSAPRDGTLFLDVRIANAGSYRGEAVLETALVARDNTLYASDAHFHTEPGQTSDLSIGPLAVPGSGSYALHAAVRDSDGKVLRRIRRNEKIQFVPLRIKIVQPAYRDTIFASQNLDAMAIDATLNFPPKQITGCVLHAALTGADGKTLASSATSRPSFPTTRLLLPVAGLPNDTHTLTVWAMNPDGKKICSQSLPLHKLPPPPAGCEVRVGDNLNLYVNGKARFPLGFMGLGRDSGKYAFLGRKGFSFNHIYHRLSSDEMRKVLDDYHAQDMMLFLYPYPRHDKIKSVKKDWLTSANEPETQGLIRDYVNALKDHPALLGWYLCDEPRGAAQHRGVREVYELLKDIDPYHPCIALDNNSAGCIRLSEASCDIIYIDPYPGFLKGGKSRRPITYTSSSVATLRNGLLRPMPIWIATQTFNYGDLPNRIDREKRPPNYREERCMFYLSLVNGVRGIIPFKIGNPDWKYKEGDNWSCGIFGSPSLKIGILEGLLPEFSALEPILRQSDSREPVLSSGKDVQVSAKHRDGEVYIFAVNGSLSTVKTRITFPPAGNDILKVLGEKDVFVQASDGNFEDTFPPYACRVYTNAKNVPLVPTVTEVKRLIEKERAIWPKEIQDR